MLRLSLSSQPAVAQTLAVALMLASTLRMTRIGLSCHPTHHHPHPIPIPMTKTKRTKRSRKQSLQKMRSPKPSQRMVSKK